MTGISGIIFPDVFQIHSLEENMLQMLSHRQEKRRPEIKDSFIYKNIRIGSIGKLIRENPKKNIFLIFDGYIYNEKEVRQELKKRGYFTENQTVEDTLIFAYEEWSEKFPDRLNGDFSIAILDTRLDKLILVRDRIGCKPLYWYQDDRHFIFASEIKALLATGLIPQAPSLEALATYLTLGYFPQDITPIENVNKLLPGHILQINLNQIKSIHDWWSYASKFTSKLKDDPITKAEKIDHTLEKAVQRRRAQEESGCFLLGGLGSGAALHYLKKLGVSPLLLFHVYLKKSMKKIFLLPLK